MFEKTNKKNLLINMLLAPLIPIALATYFIVVSAVEIHATALLITLLIGVIFYKAICLIKKYYENIFGMMVLSADWFMLDVIGIFTNNEFSFLKASILESSLKLSLNYVI